MLYLLAAHPAGLLVNRVTEWFGHVSYSVYLWHFFVLQVLVWIAGRFGFAGVGAFLLLYAATVLGTAPVAWLSHRFLERTFARWGEGVAVRVAN